MDVRVVLLGPPASGKGTQGRRLSELIKGAYFSTGRQLRREMEQETPLVERARMFLEQGSYVPDDMAVELATSWLDQVQGAWVLDGFPRTVFQAAVFDQWLGGHAPDLRAVMLEGDFEILLSRVSDRRECSQCSWAGTEKALGVAGVCPVCGVGLVQREDDEESNFRARWAAFEELTKPVADYYVESRRLLRVSGEGPPDEVFGRIRDGLGI